MQNNLDVTVAASRSHRNPKSVNKGAALMCHTWAAGHQNITPSARNRKPDIEMDVLYILRKYSFEKTDTVNGMQMTGRFTQPDSVR